MSMMVSSLLEAKGKTVFTIGPEAQVIDAIKWMAEKSIGSLVVQNKAGKVVGILSERDCLRRVILKGKNASKIAVKTIMTKKVITVSPDTLVDECMSKITDNRIRHLPVLKKGKIVGIISIGDVVKSLVSEKDFIIKNLEKYITGG